MDNTTEKPDNTMTDSTPSSNWLRGLATAFMFLTRIPMPRLENFSAADSGKALPLFPLVGLVIGLVMAALGYLLSGLLPAGVIAALLLIVWVFITGGLHLDGLGDSADGWLGGTADRERTLQIMKDPRCGSAAVMTVGCLLIGKFAALQSLIELQLWPALIAAPLLGRCVALLLFLTTPYVSKQGLAQDFLDHANQRIVIGAIVLSALASIALLGWPLALITLAANALLLFGLRQLMMNRLGGNTGDTAGASLEIIELGVLICACLTLTQPG